MSSHRRSYYGCGGENEIGNVVLDWDLPNRQGEDFVIDPIGHDDFMPTVIQTERTTDSQAKLHGKTANARHARLRLLLLRRWGEGFELEELELLIEPLWRRPFNWTARGRDQAAQQMATLSKEWREGAWKDPTKVTKRVINPALYGLAVVTSLSGQQRRG